ncbi:uncharacterized protein OCT59_003043 [Rhizophagus irregularis]|nr:hypothetical protein OCT59_003043 [Rhizophagus irregularis]
MFFPINNDKNYSDYKYGMGDLHQRLTELRRCLDDGLINQNGYDSARDEVINFWIIPERSFWQKLYDKAVDLKNWFMEDIIRPIIERINRFRIGS